MLLERHGVVFREGVNAEGLVGGFGSVYPVLKAMQDSGRVRRGYFVDGFGGAQFALPGAVERLRAERDPGDERRVSVLAATDPANPYGASLPFPRREGDERRSLARAAGARVVLVDGEPALYLERGGKGAVTLPAFDEPAVADAVLAALLESHRGGRPLTFERLDGEPAGSSPRNAAFVAAGFVAGYRGLTYRPPQRELASAGRR
jgi:ATP-dependent Lhr-like helicase